MQIAKWGNSLAVRLPQSVVDALKLKEGDQIEIQVMGARALEVEKKPAPRELLTRLRKLRGRLPAGFKPRRPFFDTNVIVYLMSGEPAKASKAESLIAGGGVISVQVLNEFASVARRKLALSWAETEEVLEALKANLEVAPLTLSVHERAVRLASAHTLNIFDASIVAAAIESGCDLVLSEHMSHGQTFETVRIKNPFL
jgi:predicted nucleic acid-binding protein